MCLLFTSVLWPLINMCMQKWGTYAKVVALRENLHKGSLLLGQVRGCLQRANNHIEHNNWMMKCVLFKNKKQTNKKQKDYLVQWNAYKMQQVINEKSFWTIMAPVKLIGTTQSLSLCPSANARTHLQHPRSWTEMNGFQRVPSALHLHNTFPTCRTHAPSRRRSADWAFGDRAR